jgi:hypothetical protein
MAERKRRAADRDTRRDSLLVLLSRVQRAVPITPAEASLLRAHVEVELTESNELRRTVAGQQDVIQQQGRQLDAAHEAIVEAEQHAADRDEQLRMYLAVYGPDAIDRTRRIRDAYDRARRLSATWRVSRDANTRHAGYELDATLDNAPRTTDTTPEQQP